MRRSTQRPRSTVISDGSGGVIVSYQNGDVAILASARFAASGRVITEVQRDEGIESLGLA